MRFVLHRYLRLLEIHPWKTTSITTGILTGIGDIISQQVIEKRGWNNHEKKRTIKLTCLGVFIIGPGQRSMYLLLDRLIPGACVASSLKKMVFSQTIWAPLIVGTLFVLSDRIDGKTMMKLKSVRG